MAGFLKGILAGVAVVAAGFLTLALLVPPAPAPTPRNLEAASDVPAEASAASETDEPETPDPNATATHADSESTSESTPTDSSTAAQEPTETTPELSTEHSTDESADDPTDVSSEASTPDAPEPAAAPPVEPATDPTTPDAGNGAAQAAAADDGAAPADEPADASHPRPDAAEPAEVTPPDAPIAPHEPSGSEPAQAASPNAATRRTETSPVDLDAEHIAPRVIVQPEEAAQEPAPDAAPLPEALALAAERGAEAAEGVHDPAESAVDDPEAAIADPASGDPVADDTDADAPAWQRYAATFSPIDTRPLYAVILIDAPADAHAEAKLLALTAPVTVALDPSDPDAPRRAEAYRSAGHEVAILATDGDDANALEAHVGALPQAVAWIAATASAWPGDADASDLAAALAAEGLLAVLPANGPDAADAPAAPHARAVVAIDPETDDRSAALEGFDRSAAAADNGAVVALVGHAAHSAMLEALMQRAGRESGLPAAPAPLSAAAGAAQGEEAD